MNKLMTKPSGRKPMRIGAILLKEAPVKDPKTKVIKGYLIDLTWKGAPTKSGRGHKTKHNWRHAEEFAAKENKKLELLKEKGAGRYTFNDAIDSFLKEREDLSKAKDNTGCTRDTFVILQGICENHLRPRFGNMRLTEISSMNIRDWVIEQRKIAKPRTVRARWGVLNLVLNYAAERDMLLVNPLKVRKVKEVPGNFDQRAKIPDRSALETLREYLNGPRPLKHARFSWSCARMVALLSISCGLRAGEMSALTWDDIDQETGDIDINKARAQLQGMKGPKTSAGIRKVPIPLAARAIIEEHAEVYKQHYGKCVGFVLRSAHKDHLPPSRISIVFADTMRDCGLTDAETKQVKFTCHAGRHWAGSLWMKSTADIHLTKKWMGHKHASMTLDIYGHSIDDTEGRAKFQKMPDWWVAPIQIETPSATRPVEMTESPRALPAPEDFEFGPKVNGNVEPEWECPIAVPSIAEPYVVPFIKLLHQGRMSVPDAYYEIGPQIPNLRSTKNPAPLKLNPIAHKVCAEFRRLKLPTPNSLFARFRYERMLKLHGQGYQAFEIAQQEKCDKSLVHQVLRSRHKPNASNPLNYKINPPRPKARPPQPGHKIQLKLL